MAQSDRQYLVDLVLSFYIGEPCRICGEAIKAEDTKDFVYAGYSKGNKSRSAHKECWDSNKPKSEWAYPEDDEGATDDKQS